MRIIPQKILGMDLFIFTNKGVRGTFALGDNWITLYSIRSENENRGECQETLLELKTLYSKHKFGSTPALNDKMRHILKKLDIEEYV